MLPPPSTVSSCTYTLAEASQRVITGQTCDLKKTCTVPDAAAPPAWGSYLIADENTGLDGFDVHSCKDKRQTR